MMKIVAWVTGVLVSIPALYMILIYGASELGGEVVTLDRAEPGGEVSKVRIWIVDQDGMSWIEHGAADSYWVTRLNESPDVILQRDGQSTSYVGAPDPDSHKLYHQLRQEKYSWADDLIATLTGSTGECQGVPVRLQDDS